MRTAMNRDHRRQIAQHATDLLVQVIQGIAVFSEYNQFALAATGFAHLGCMLQDLW